MGLVILYVNSMLWRGGEVEIFVDGEKYNVKGGKLLEVLLDLGFDIPHLCYHKAVGSYGACRLCLVEVEVNGDWKVVTSCSIDVSEGMRVKTISKRIFELRKSILELLAKSSSPRLISELFEKYGVEFGDSEKSCILCGLCVNVCNLIGVGAISFVGRGTNRTVAAPFDLPSEFCLGCLACVNVCPTGAMRFDNGVLTVDGNVLAKVEVAKCSRCGKDVVSIKMLEKLEIDEVLCEECRRREAARKFAVAKGYRQL